MTTSTRKKIAAGAAATAAVGATLALALGSGSSVGADPFQFKTGNLVGVGSDTTQEVLNAFASGPVNGIFYPPLATSDGTYLLSFDATQDGTVDTCIETRTGSPAIYRPNGSSEGRRALSRSLDGGVYGIAACGVKSPAGLVDFARSSSGPSGTPGVTFLQYGPFARDALSFAYADTNASTVTTLTSVQLQSLFSTGPQIIGGNLVVPCGIQKGSGTYQFWRTNALGLSEAQDDAGTAFCNGLGGVPNADGRLQENKADQLRAKATILAGTVADECDGAVNGVAVSCAGAQAVVGFSAGNFIAAANGTVPFVDPFSVNVDLGAIDALGIPYSGTAPNLVPRDGAGEFYTNGTYGRDVYNVLPNETADDPFNTVIQEMFIGPSSVVCSATTTIRAFGFGAISNCGVKQPGALVSGTK